MKEWDKVSTERISSRLYILEWSNLTLSWEFLLHFLPELLFRCYGLLRSWRQVPGSTVPLHLGCSQRLLAPIILLRLFMFLHLSSSGCRGQLSRALCAFPAPAQSALTEDKRGIRWRLRFQRIQGRSVQGGPRQRGLEHCNLCCCSVTMERKWTKAAAHVRSRHLRSSFLAGNFYPRGSPCRPWSSSVLCGCTVEPAYIGTLRPKESCCYRRDASVTEAILILSQNIQYCIQHFGYSWWWLMMALVSWVMPTQAHQVGGDPQNPWQ